MMLTGAPIAADEAQRIGLVNRVVPAADADDRSARRWPRQLAAKAPIAMRYILDAVNKGVEMPFAEACQYEATLFGLVASTDDMREGTRGVSREAQADVQGQVARVSRAMQTIQGSGRAAGFRFAVVVSKYNDFVTDRLQAGALAALAAAGVAPSDITLVRVPGAFEIPLAAQHAAESGRFDAVVCLGCLIRGETPHFEYIASAVAHGLTEARGGDRRADGVRRADDQLDRGSAGARGRGQRQQGARGGGGGDRNGGGCRAADAAGDAEDLAGGARAEGPAPPGPRGGAADPVSVGRRQARHRASRPTTFFELQWPNTRSAGRRPARRSRPRWRATPRRGSSEIDPLIADTAERWRPERMAVLDRLILRMAVCELLRDAATPPAVVINEALELARTFSTEEAVKFINGMLDAIRKKIERRATTVQYRRLCRSHDEQVQQRQCQPRRSSRKLGVEVYPRTLRAAAHRSRELVDGARRAAARRARGRARRRR